MNDKRAINYYCLFDNTALLGCGHGGVIIDCIQFPSLKFGTFPISKFGTFPISKFGMFPTSKFGTFLI